MHEANKDAKHSREGHEPSPLPCRCAERRSPIEIELEWTLPLLNRRSTDDATKCKIDALALQYGFFLKQQVEE